MHVFSIDIPFKGSQSHSNMRSKVTAVSMTLLWMSHRCQWLCCAYHSGVNDTAVQVTAVPMTLLFKSQRCHLHRCVVCSKIICPHKNSIVVDHSQKFSTKLVAQWCHWHHFDIHSSVIDTAVTCTAVSLTMLSNQLCWFSMQIQSHIQKGFNPCIRGLGEVVWWNRGRKSRVRVPLNVNVISNKNKSLF
jgi:hypothetical protein